MSNDTRAEIPDELPEPLKAEVIEVAESAGVDIEESE